MTPAPLQLGQAPSEFALNNDGFTPLTFAKAVRIGSSSPVYVAGLLRREPLIAPWSTDTTPSRPDTEPWISELFPDPATPVSTASTPSGMSTSTSCRLWVLAPRTSSTPEGVRTDGFTDARSSRCRPVSVPLARSPSTLPSKTTSPPSVPAPGPRSATWAAIAIADHVVGLGPGAGTEGGEVVFEGSVDGLRASGTLTGRHLDDRASVKPSVRTPSGVLEVRGASTHNLQDVDVDIPLGVLAVLTGVAGSGKSSLIQGSVSGRDGVVSVDQGAIKGSRRSNPATYTGLLDPIRTAFAKVNGVKPSLFSANSEGACPNCNGAGVIYTDLAMMAGVATVCEVCEGKRFQAEVLEYTFGGKDISEVLAMSVTEAEEFFGAGEARIPAAHAILDRLADVGLGYLSLGQPLPTLSGGERQRLKLATQMAEKGDVYVLDEPTTGLHLADVEQLLGLLDRLVDSGKSAIVISHHQAVMAHADWIIDLGPGAGHDGGRIVFEGTPADLVAARPTLTGEHLAASVGT